MYNAVIKLAKDLEANELLYNGSDIFEVNAVNHEYPVQGDSFVVVAVLLNREGDPQVKNYFAFELVCTLPRELQEDIHRAQDDAGLVDIKLSTDIAVGDVIMFNHHPHRVIDMEEHDEDTIALRLQQFMDPQQPDVAAWSHFSPEEALVIWNG